MRIFAAAAMLALSIQPSLACHKFSIWNYSRPQPRCGVARQLVRPMPLLRQEAALTPPDAPDLPLPSLEPFVAAPEGPERLRGIGLLAQAERIN